MRSRTSLIRSQSSFVKVSELVNKVPDLNFEVLGLDSDPGLLVDVRSRLELALHLLHDEERKHTNVRFHD